MIKLTERQEQVLAVIRHHVDQTGYPPTRADIAKAMNFRSANAAEEHLKALARKGAIDIIPGASRGIRLTEDRGLPLIGRVAAGSPVLAQEHIEDYVSLQANFFSPAADFLLQVTGDSMMNVGILDGDLLAVHQCVEARENQIVVARIDDEVTVKRLRRPSPNVVELVAENPAYDPIVVNLAVQHFAIEGVSVGVIRR
mgnify:FL=1